MKKIVIIGNSAAGLSALENFRKHDQESQVTVISKEGKLPYSRVLIPYILRKKISYAGIHICPEDYFEKYHAEMICDEVIGIDIEKQTVKTEQTEYPYDELLIATGSYAVSPPIEGINQEGVFHMWTQSDLDHLIPYFDHSKKVCVIGSGFVALQAAWAARYRGLDVVVLELMDRIMPSVLDEEGARLLTEKIREKGVNLRTGVSTQRFEKMDDGTFKIHLAGGEEIEADFVIVGTGVRSNIGFLKDTDIQTERGILVDSHMRTNIPNIYAAGDVAAGPTTFGDEHLIHALWPTACEMGKTAGKNMAGIDFEYEGSLNMNVTEMYGVTVASMGKFYDADADQTYVFDETAGYGYLKICYKDDKVVGACLVGSSDAVKIFGKMRPIIRKKESIECKPEEIFDYINKTTFNEMWRKGL